MHVRWTTLAAQDLFQIVQRVQKDSSAAAAQVANKLYEGCERLQDFPRRGRTGRVEGTRELIVPGLPYIVVYRIQEHGAQDWP
jgi:toxin ParE1/3/4